MIGAVQRSSPSRRRSPRRWAYILYICFCAYIHAAPQKKAHRRDDIESDSESSATEGSDSDTDSLDSESSSSSSDEPVAKSRRCRAAPAQKVFIYICVYGLFPLILLSEAG
jgi:hypothetical protein